MSIYPEGNIYMNRIFFSIYIFIVLAFVNISANTLVENQALGLRCYLPSGWEMTVENDTVLSFTNSTDTNYGAICLLTRHSLDGETPTDWTRSFFIAQKMLYDYSVQNFSRIIFYDSSVNSKQQNSWAPAMYTRCVNADTVDYTWDEYVYFTSINGYGYEFCVLGDTSDMERNIDYYSDFLHGIIINNGTTASSNFLLSNLTVSPTISFTPQFTPSVGSYSATVGLSVDKISICPVLDDPQAKMTVQGNSSSSGTTVSDIPLAIGENTVTINVTAPDNQSLKSYTFSINRLNTDISVKRQVIRKAFPAGRNIAAYDLRGKKININYLEKSSGFARGIYIYNNGNNTGKLKQFLYK